MIIEQFRDLAKYCQGNGIEFGEGPERITNGLQIRANRNPVPGAVSKVIPPGSTGIAKESLDYVCCIHYLEHYSDPKPILKHWLDLLKPGGVLVLCLPEAGKYPRVGEAGCNPDHRVDFTLLGIERDLTALDLDTGFEVMDKGYSFDNFYFVISKGPAIEVQAAFTSPKYSIVIPVYNNKAITQACVESILQVASPDEIICVDDGSVMAQRFSHKSVKVLRLSRNSGFPYAVNYGVSKARHEFIVLLNNDTIMQPGGIEKLLSALKDPSVAIAGQDGGRLDRNYIFAGKVTVDPDYIEMFCCAFRKTVWEKVGALDLDFGLGYSEDADWSMRAKKLGYRLKVVGECCRHKESATFGRGPDVLARIERNREYLIKKHHKGTCLWVMASLGCNGGSKVVYKLASAMQDDGWQVDFCSMEPWEKAGSQWNRFGKVVPADVVSTEPNPIPVYDVVVSTYYTTMPVAYQIPCQQRFALIQSDEPEWPDNLTDKKSVKAIFSLPNFKHIIIADHMRWFDKKYGMNIVGQIENGVDSLVFNPQWTFERPWPHKLLLIRKSAPVWYTGAEYAEDAVRILANRYRDLEVVVLGGDKPRWPCKVKHVRTFDEAEVCKLYNSVSCVVVSSLIEGCSLVPLEAMASGCPVVSTRVGMDYAVDGESYLLVPYKDGGAIADAVGRIFDDAELRWRLYRGGLKLAHSRTWENEQEQFLSIIYKECGKQH